VGHKTLCVCVCGFVVASHQQSSSDGRVNGRNTPAAAAGDGKEAQNASSCRIDNRESSLRQSVGQMSADSDGDGHKPHSTAGQHLDKSDHDQVHSDSYHFVTLI